MIFVTKDTTKLDFALARLAAAARVELGLVIKQEAGNISKTIMMIVPPTGEKIKGGQMMRTVGGGFIQKAKMSGLSKNAQQQGENAIKGDLFGGKQMRKEKSIGLFQRIGSSELIPPKGKRTQFAYVTLGNEFKNNKRIGIYQKFWRESASISEMMAFHKRYRNNRGRIGQITRSPVGRWMVQDQMWVSNQSADAYLKYTQSKVGWAKAGFAASAIACGIRVPAWIRDWASRAGRVQSNFGANPYVIATTAGNKIPDIQRYVDGAFKIRERVTLAKVNAILVNRAVNLGFAKISNTGVVTYNKNE
jgi:hypothetical protein